MSDIDLAEDAILGSCLLDEAAMNWCFYHLDENYFQNIGNKKLFEVMKRMFKTGIAVDYITLSNSLTPDEKKKVSHLALNIHQSVDRVHNIKHYSNLMMKAYVNQQLEKSYEKVKNNPLDQETQKEIRRLWDMMNSQGNSVIPLNEASQSYVETIEARKSGKADRILTGFIELDRNCAGFYRNNLIVVGARTSIGKSSFLINLATKFIREKRRVLFVSAEMSWDEILDRMMADISGFNVSQLRRGDLSSADLPKLINSLSEITDLPMWGIEGGRMSLSRLRMAIEVTKPDIIFVDFIQRFTPPNYNISKASYISDVANDLKSIAMERKVVVIAASQLNREVEKGGKEDTEPRLDHLKESGGIEEAADVVLLLKAKDDIPGENFRRIKVYIRKNRNGPTGMVDFVFDKQRTKFSEEEKDLTSQSWQEKGE